MKNKGWMTGLFLIILTIMAIAARIYYINNWMSEVKISEDIYNAAQVSVGTAKLSAFFADGFDIQSLYISNLYAAFVVFGNFTVAGVYLNILYQVLTVLLIYVSARNLTNQYVGLGAGLASALLPFYIAKLSEVTVFNMGLFIAFVFCSIVTFAARIIYEKRVGKKAVKKEMQEPQNIAPVTELEVKPVQDMSMKEILLDDLEDNKINYIENPLPVPKRKEHKEMDFAIELSSENDDYDLKDMSGKDFYDIE